MSCIDQMPQSVQSAFIRARRDRKPENAISIVRMAIEAGVTDVNKLADIPFFLSHPELENRALKRSETLLVRDWIATRDNLDAFVKAVLRNTGDPELSRWLELLDTTQIKPKLVVHDDYQMRIRAKELERMQVFMAKASAMPHKYNTEYRMYNYRDGQGRKHGAAERTFQVDAFKFVGTQNALRNLQKQVKELGDDSRKFPPVFRDLEYSVYAHTSLAWKWVQTGATNDGPTKSDSMETQLNWLVSQSRKPSSIYSVYRSSLLAAHKAFNDDSPRTAGLPSGIGSWEDWRKVFWD